MISKNLYNMCKIIIMSCISDNELKKFVSTKENVEDVCKYILELESNGQIQDVEDLVEIVDNKMISKYIEEIIISSEKSYYRNNIIDKIIDKHYQL
jgi:hypothetical protein